MPTIASLIVRIGANDQQIQSALASVGQKAKSVDADLKKLGGTALGAKAEASLKDLKGAMDQITKAQERVAEKARLMAAGLDAMGGAAKLTDKELKQVQRTLSEGIGAYEALGKKAPAELQKVADAIKTKLDAPMGGLNAKMVALGTALGTALGGAALQIGRQMFDAAQAAIAYGDALTNLSARTQVSVQGLQRLEAIGNTAEVSLDTMANSVSVLQRNLDSVASQKALKDIGLNFQTIRHMEPEEMFLTVAKSVAGIEDPIKRANAGTALFAKTWNDISPAVQGDIQAVIDSVHNLSDEQVAALAEADAALDTWSLNMSRRLNSAGGNLAMYANEVGALETFIRLPMIALGDERLIEYARQLKAVRLEAEAFLRMRPPTPPTPLPIGAGPKPPMDIDKYLADTAKRLDAEKKAADAAKAFTEQLFSKEAITNADGLVRALGGVENLSKLTGDATRHLHGELGKAIEVYRAMQREVPAALLEIYNRTLPLRTFEVKAVVGPSLAGLQKTFLAFGDVMQDGTIYARDLTYELTQSTIQYDKFGNVIKTDVIPPLGNLNGIIIETTSLSDELAAGLKNAFGSLPQLLKDAFTGAGGLMGALKAFGVQMAEALTGPLMARLSTVLAKYGSAIASAVGLGTSVATPIAATAATTAGTAVAATAAGGGGAAAAGAGGAGILGGISAAQAIPIAGGIAAAAYGVYRGIKALKEQNAHKEVNRLREVFFDLQGGLESLNPRVQMLTGNVDAVQQVFDARNPKQYQEALANLEAILERGRQQFAELQTSVGTASEKLTALTTVTPDVQTALDGLFDATSPGEYLTKVAGLNKALDEQAAKGQLVKDTIAKYGIAFKDSGKQFQQSQINERAQGLTKDFLTLKGAGVEINAQMRAMGPSINTFVKDAKVAGVEVPESMRSIIQHAIDAGEIFDADGKKITDMKDLGLTFGSTMETTMKNVGGAVEKLGLVLEGLAKFLKIDLGNAAKEGADDVNRELANVKDVEVDVNVNPPSGLPDKNAPTGEPQAPGAMHGARVKPWGLQHLAGGGFARGTDTVPAMLTPGELVLNANQQRALFGAVAPVVVNLSIAIDGVFSEGDLVQTVQRRVAPILAQTIEDNVAGSRTRFQDVLGVP